MADDNIDGSSPAKRPTLSRKPIKSVERNNIQDHINTLRSVLDNDERQRLPVSEGGLSVEQRIAYGEALGKLTQKAPEFNTSIEATSASEVSSAYGGNANTVVGAATPADLNLSRFGHLEPRIQLGLKNTLLAGFSGDLASGAAIENFTSITGMAPEKFASMMTIPEGVVAPNSREDKATVLSVLNTAGAYLNRGPGQTLAGYQPTEARTDKASNELDTAMGYLGELTSLYIDDRTIGSPVEEARRQAVQESLYGRLLEGVFYDGSKSLLPMPNETGITGIKATRTGKGSSVVGTVHDRLSFAGEFGDLYTIDGSTGHYIFNPGVTEDQQKEFWNNRPSLKGSLFPVEYNEEATQSERDRLGRTQNYEMSQAQTKAEFVRRVLREQFPTNRDESAGQINMAGFDRPYDEQALIANLRDKAAHLGLERDGGEVSVGGISEVDIYVEEQLALIQNQEKDDREARKQGDAEWLGKRKGKITASQAAILLMGRGPERMAAKLAEERLGHGSTFRGNAHTREGQEGEAKAARAFLATEGKGLRMEEAYFNTTAEHVGFGVSPDGFLYNEDGTSAGLLELKYLSTSSMEGALKKYTPQMQLQMAITGESQTNFYALDKYTGEYEHGVVMADPDMQKQLLESGREALKIQAGLTRNEVMALKEDLKVNRGRRQPRTKVTGQNSSFHVKEEVTAQMPAFRDVKRPTSSAEARQTANAVMNSNEDRPGDIATELFKISQAEDREKIQDKWNKSDPAALAIAKEEERASADLANAKDGEAASSEELEEAAKGAANSLREFKAATKEASNILGELAGLVTSGTSSIMDEERLARKSGMSLGDARGVRDVLRNANVSTKDAQDAMISVGRQSAQFAADPKSVVPFARSLARMRSEFGSEEMQNLIIPDAGDLLRMAPKERMATYLDMVQSISSDEERSQLATALGVEGFATANSIEGQDLLTAFDSRADGRLPKAKRTDAGVGRGDQKIRDGRELSSQGGYKVGLSARLAEEAATVGSSATFGKAIEIASGAGLLATGAAVTSKGRSAISTAIKAAKSGGGKLAKGLATAAKVTPAGLMAGGALLGARHLTGIEDDGDLADSGMDILEFAAMGATVGTFVGPLGTLGGAAVGTAIGVGNELWEAYQAMPDDTIEQPALPNQPMGTSSRATIENLEVNVSVDPDMIKTEVDMDGSAYMNQETGYGQ